MNVERGLPLNLNLPRPPPAPTPLLPIVAMAKAFPRPVGVLRQGNVPVFDIPAEYWPTAAEMAQQPITPKKPPMPRWPTMAKATVTMPTAPGELTFFMAEARRLAVLQKFNEQKCWREEMLQRFGPPVPLCGQVLSAPAEAPSEVPSFVETASDVPTFVGTSASGSEF